MSTEQIIQSWEKGIEPYLSETPTPTDHASRNGQAKLTKEQRKNIRFAIRWMDGDKLYRVYHVKGAAWKPFPSLLVSEENKRRTHQRRISGV